jgi:hypothetical protein
MNSRNLSNITTLLTHRQPSVAASQTGEQAIIASEVRNEHSRAKRKEILTLRFQFGGLRKTAQLAEKIRSLYTGNLPQRIHSQKALLAAWETMRAGRVHG